jgi:hypothetical protein
LSQSSDVENKHDALIAELGCSRDASRLREWILNRTHYNLALSDYSIDRESDRVCFLTYYEDVEFIGTLVIHLKHPSETQEGQNFSAIRNDFVILQHPG